MSYKTFTELIINSKDRERAGTTNSNNFTYLLTDLPMNQIKRWRVNKVSIPFSFYTIENQQFQLEENGSFIAFPDFPSGSYTANELAVLVENTINAIGVSGTYSCTYNPQNGKFTISVNAPNTFSLNWTVNNLPADKQYKSLGIAMGFTTEANFQNTSAGTVQIAPFVANISGPSNLYIKSTTLQNDFTSYFNKEKLNVIEEVPIDVNRFEWINYTNPNKDWFCYDKRGLDSLDLQLVDDHNQLIDLNGRDWIINIIFEHLDL